MHTIRRLLIVLALAAAAPAAAETAYKCTGANGRVSYQDTPCPVRTRQQTIPLADPGPARPPARIPAGNPATVPPGQSADMPAPAAAPASVPLLYRCRKATDGSTYVSSRGNPAPYAVPFGILGALSQPLGSVYGTGGAGASAPELNRGKVTPGLVANNYVWVRDACRPMDIGETCAALQQQYDENERKLSQAFKSEQAPFVRREAELEAQLAGCSATR
ncbi:MAG: DUF4124 domain-containing protein [Xanthomonadaceae bacterium]|nr:DUF4124 domain-containing protein [Xanthomonadaceae bacterium]MDE1965124.1 DUF4124 domain-containing protein [Xanthomonadaceae bacterium]